MERIGFIGAGMMGSGIVLNLRKAGYQLLVYKRKIDTADDITSRLLEADIQLTDKLEEVFSFGELLLTCLPDSPTVERIITGKDGLLSVKDTPVETVIDFTTAHPDSTKDLVTELGKRHISFLDAPMTGGPPQAAAGELGLAVGGTRELYDRFSPMFELIAKHYQYAGSSGSGNLLKLINNFFGIMNTCATAAAYAMIEESEVDKDAFYSFISQSGGNSNAFRSIMAKIQSGDFTLSFELGLAHKDISYMKDFFERSGGFPIFSGTYEVMEQAMEDGFAQRDLREVYFSIKEHLKPLK